MALNASSVRLWMLNNVSAGPQFATMALIASSMRVRICETLEKRGASTVLITALTIEIDGSDACGSVGGEKASNEGVGDVGLEMLEESQPPRGRSDVTSTGCRSETSREIVHDPNTRHRRFCWRPPPQPSASSSSALDTSVFRNRGQCNERSRNGVAVAGSVSTTNIRKARPRQDFSDEVVIQNIAK